MIGPETVEIFLIKSGHQLTVDTGKSVLQHFFGDVNQIVSK